MTVWFTAFSLGLLGSLHCLGMCGPLVLAIPPGRALVRGRLVYHAGRILTYGAIGAAAGLIGRPLQLASSQQLLSVCLGAVIVGAALVILWRPRNVPGQELVLRFVQRLKALFARGLKKKGLGARFTLGMLNGLLPCGLVYMALAGAVLAGGWLNGLIFMLCFGLGTGPMMLAVSLFGLKIRERLPMNPERLIPVGCLIIGCLLLARGMALDIPVIGGACCDPAQ